MHVCMHVCMCVCVYVGMHVCIYVCVYVCMYAGMYVCMYVYLPFLVRLYVSGLCRSLGKGFVVSRMPAGHFRTRNSVHDIGLTLSKALQHK